MDQLSNRRSGIAIRPTSLFTPISAGRLRLKNRIVALPIGLSRYIDSNSSPTERMVHMYRARAAGGAALVTIEATYVEAYQPSRPGLLGFHSDNQIAQYAVLTDAIHSAGALASIEIVDRWHSDFPYEMADFTEQQIEAMIDLYVRASVRAMAAGFDAVTYQMTHGWPLSRFASPLTNNRHDKYGDYAFVGAQVLRRTRAAVGDSLALIPRFSILEDPHGKRGVTLQQAVDELAPAYEDAGADMLDLSLGLGPIAKTSKDHWATELIYDPPGDKFHLFKAVKDVVSVPVVGRSGVNDADVARRAVDEGWMDLLGLGRQMLADPAFPRKVQEGEDDEIVRCPRCQFCGRVTVGSRVRMQPLHCAVNGSHGREIAGWRPRPRARPKKVGVVGAGPAGLQAALSLTEYGCEVTVFERGGKVGGLIPVVAAMPNLRLLDLQYAIEDLERRLRATSVDIRLNSVFDEGTLDAETFDALVLATGSAPREGSGDGSVVRSFLDYLSGEPLGRKVVVDGQREGAEYAVSLARSGHEVVLVEASRRLKPTSYDYSLKRADALEDYLRELSVDVRWNSRLGAVEGRRVTVEHRGGTKTAIEADTVLLTQRSVVRLDAGRLRTRVPVVHEIGDCVELRGLGEAMEEGRTAAVALAAEVN